jgi:hypothetical protein
MQEEFFLLGEVVDVGKTRYQDGQNLLEVL